MAAKKDLPTKKTVKGGGINLGNDNLTLVRAARPAKRIVRPGAR